MKKYKSGLIILLVLLCVVAALQLYKVTDNVYSIVWNIKYEIPKDAVTISVFGLVLNVLILGVSVFGIVTVAKIVSDKQAFEPLQTSDADKQTDGDKK